MSYSPVNALLMSLRGQRICFLVYFMCILGYILTTVEGLQKINLERA